VLAKQHCHYKRY